jgi:hypothetical protein
MPWPYKSEEQGKEGATYRATTRKERRAGKMPALRNAKRDGLKPTPTESVSQPQNQFLSG